MQTIILAGGMGTRLRGVVNDRPKPMVKVAGKPFLEYQIDVLKQYDLTDLILCVGYLSEQIVDYFGDGARWGIRIQYALEEYKLLGTGGAVKNAGALIGGTFLMVNGDTFFDLDLTQLIRFHERRKLKDANVLGTLSVVEVTDPSAYGSVWMNSEHRIVSFAEKAYARYTGQAVNAGVYVLEPAVLKFIPSGERVSIEKDTFPLILNEGGNLLGYVTSGSFIDIGTPEGYSRFQTYIGEMTN
jgi:NDP-sugar pyrophosphorylase family protein